MGRWSARYIIYSEKNLIVQKDKNCYTIMNTALPFKYGHCHVKSLRSAKSVIRYVVTKEIPYNPSNYFLLCLQRVTDDKEYSGKLQALKQSGAKYFEEFVR